MFALKMSTLSPQVDEGENPLAFSQIFQLIPEGGSYYVYVLFTIFKV